MGYLKVRQGLIETSFMGDTLAKHVMKWAGSDLGKRCFSGLADARAGVPQLATNNS